MGRIPTGRPLAKTSFNVKQHRQFQFDPATNKPKISNVTGGPRSLDASQVEARRMQYANSIGLKPEANGNMTRQATGSEGVDIDVPAAKGNRLPFAGQFGIEHETGHAMMTPEGKTINQYQKWLTDHSKPAPINEEDDFFDEDEDHRDAQHHENVANNLEYKIDRRAGLDPNRFKSSFRDTVTGPIDPRTGAGEVDENDYHDKSGSVVTSRFPDPGVGRANIRADGTSYKKDPIVGDGIRDDAAHYAQRFDNGAKFNRYGKVVPPQGVNANINERAQMEPQGRLESLRERARGMKKSKPLYKHNDAATSKLITDARRPPPTPADATVRPQTVTKDLLAQAKAPSWQGRTILDEKHKDDLDTLAGINEFGEPKMHRQAAEDEAYNFYQKQQRTNAAGHHLRGMLISKGIGDQESAVKHAAMYKLHLKALGHDDVGKPPPEVLAAARSTENKNYKFKPHKADTFAINDHHEGEMAKAEISDRLEILKKAAETVLKADELLKKKKKPVPCICTAYSHPHRTGGGKCQAAKDKK